MSLNELSHQCYEGSFIIIREGISLVVTKLNKSTINMPSDFHLVHVTPILFIMLNILVVSKPYCQNQRIVATLTIWNILNKMCVHMCTRRERKYKRLTKTRF